MKKTKLHKVLAIALTLLIVFAMPTVAASANDVPEPTGVELTDTESTGAELTDIETADIEEELADASTMALFTMDTTTASYALPYYVYDSNNYEDLSGVTVELWEIDDNLKKIGSVIDIKTTTDSYRHNYMFENLSNEVESYGLFVTSVPSGYELPQTPTVVKGEELREWSPDGGNVYVGIPLPLMTLSADTKYNYEFTAFIGDDYSKKLSGVIVELWEINSDFEKVGSAIATKTTGSDGTVVFTGLLKGDYAVFPIAVPTGYNLSSSFAPVREEYFNNYFTKDGVPTVSNGMGFNLALPVDTKYNISISVYSQDDVYGNGISGVTFELWRMDDNGQKIGSVIDTKTTNSDGDVLFKGIKKGNYVVIPTKVPEGYNLPTHNRMTFVEERFETYYLVDKIPTIRVQFPVCPILPEDTNYTLQLTVFEDYTFTKRASEETVELWKVDSNNNKIGSVIATEVTNSDGQVTFAGVLRGNYGIFATDGLLYTMIEEKDFNDYYYVFDTTLSAVISKTFALTYEVLEDSTIDTNSSSSSSSSSGTTAQGSNTTGSTGSGGGSTGGSNSNFPQTGDNNNVIGYAFVSVFSLVALAVIAVKRKRIIER